MPEKTSLHQGFKDFIAGGLAGVAQILSSHPLDTIKTTLQAEGGQRYAGTLDLARDMIRKEGFLGLYKGMLSPLVGIAFVNSVLFASFGGIAGFVHPDKSTPLQLREVAVAGAGAGIVQSFLASPIEMLKIKMQTQDAAAKLYSGPFDCLRQIQARHGIKGVFNGLGATMLREAPAYAAWYSTYEFTKRKLVPAGTTDIDPLKLMFAGAAGGVAYWTATYPLDRAKTLIQSQDLYNPTYRNALHALQQIIQKEGVLALWRGFTPCLLRCIPASACTFLTYEVASKMLNDK